MTTRSLPDPPEKEDLRVPKHSPPEEEGLCVPEHFPPVVDAHVHLFPDAVFSAVWRWFDRHAWPIRYKMSTDDLVRFLIDKGVQRIVGLHYAHTPGLARLLNAYMADLSSRYPQVQGTATVLPGEDGALDILGEAFRLGLKGVKLHAHVQGFRMDSQAMHDIYAFCEQQQQPLVMHVGREPKNHDYDYEVDPYEICKPDLLEEVLAHYKGLKVCVPHLGADDFSAYQRMLERHDNLWLDTTMILADYIPTFEFKGLADLRPDRVMYGTDFPNIPYAWDRELKKIAEMNLPDGVLARLLGGNASEFYGL